MDLDTVLTAQTVEGYHSAPIIYEQPRSKTEYSEKQRSVWKVPACTSNLVGSNDCAYPDTHEPEFQLAG